MDVIITEGRACVVLKGRHAGKKVAITKTGKMEKNIVEVITEQGKKKKINMRHLWPLEILKGKDEKKMVEELKNMELK